MIYCSLLLIIDSSKGASYKMQTSSPCSQIFVNFIVLHKFYKVEENGDIKTDRSCKTNHIILKLKKKKKNSRLSIKGKRGK